MYIMNRHFNNRAVSQIIAALLLIAIAVAAAILLYVFSIGLLGSLGSGGGQQTKEQVIMEAYSFTGVASVAVTLRNVGPSAVNLATADYFINGVMVSSPTVCAGGSAVLPQGSCAVTLTVPASASVISGAAYPLKIVTPTGGVFSYSVIAGSSS